MSASVVGRQRGRPGVTTPDEIERVAFGLFARDGFDRTTLDAIAAEVGVGRRTLFHYYRSKNDIPWGQFDRTLDGFRDVLAAQSADLPLWEAVHRGVLAFNAFPPDADPPHRDRMRLILRTPTLQAHSALRYRAWRDVIAEHVAARMGAAADDPAPRVVAHASLAVALEAYETWLDRPGSDLLELVDDGMAALRRHLGADLGG